MPSTKMALESDCLLLLDMADYYNAILVETFFLFLFSNTGPNFLVSRIRLEVLSLSCSKTAFQLTLQ